jgi:hypothetical protein
VAEPEVLFHNISNLGYFFVTLFLIFSQFCRGCIFSHNAVGNVIEGQKIPVGFSGISLVGIYFFDRLFGVTAVYGAIRETVGIID